MATFGSRNLKKGSTGSDVRELQTKLNSIGYNCGSVDGIFGTKTLAAVKKFQQKYKLAVDGIVGKNTYKKLAEVLKKASAASSNNSPAYTTFTATATRFSRSSGFTLDRNSQFILCNTRSGISARKRYSGGTCTT